MPQLQWNFRYVLVTYAQCGDLDPWRVVERFSSLGAECIVGREHHEDGGLHLHVFADFGRKFRSRKADVLDVDGRHPNLAPVKRTPAKAYDYAIKDGDVVAGGLERPLESGVGDGSSADKWARITQAEDRDEFWTLVHELDPKAAACSFNALSKYADWRFAEKPPEYEHNGGIKFVPGDADGRDDWVSQSGIGLDEPFLGMWYPGARADTYILGSLNDEVPRASRTPGARACLRGGPLATPSPSASHAGPHRLLPKFMLTKQAIGLNLWSCSEVRGQAKQLGLGRLDDTYTALDWSPAPSVPKGLTQSMPYSTTSEVVLDSFTGTRSGSVLSLMYPSRSCTGSPTT